MKANQILCQNSIYRAISLMFLNISLQKPKILNILTVKNTTTIIMKPNQPHTIMIMIIRTIKIMGNINNNTLIIIKIIIPHHTNLITVFLTKTPITPLLRILQWTILTCPRITEITWDTMMEK